MKKTYKVKADEELVSHWQNLGTKIQEMAWVVQNDGELTEKRISEYKIRCEIMIEMVEYTANETLEYLYTGKKQIFDEDL
jgi:choline kinase